VRRQWAAGTVPADFFATARLDAMVWTGVPNDVWARARIDTLRDKSFTRTSERSAIPSPGEHDTDHRRDTPLQTVWKRCRARASQLSGV